MNDNQQLYLLFRVEGCIYAIDVIFIHEIFLLPQLKSIADVQKGIAGYFNFHRAVIPAYDLHVCLGYPIRTYLMSDYVVTIKQNELFFGVILSDILDVKKIEIESSKKFHKMSDEQKLRCSAITSLGMFGGEIVFVLEPQALADLVNQMPAKSSKEIQIQFQFSQEDQIILSERAIHLSKELIKKMKQDLVSLTIILYNNEFFGVNSEFVREFCVLLDYTPVSFPDSHLIGFMNLRGNILPLMDVWKVIGLQGIEIKSSTKVLVINLEDVTVGILIDDIVDVVKFAASEFKWNPLTIKGIEEQYIKNAIQYENNILGVLDMKKVMESIQLPSRV